MTGEYSQSKSVAKARRSPPLHLTAGSAAIIAMALSLACESMLKPPADGLSVSLESNEKVILSDLGCFAFVFLLASAAMFQLCPKELFTGKVYTTVLRLYAYFFIYCFLMSMVAGFFRGGELGALAITIIFPYLHLAPVLAATAAGSLILLLRKTSIWSRVQTYWLLATLALNLCLYAATFFLTHH